MYIHFDVKQNKSSSTQAAQIFINKYLDAKKRKFGEKKQITNI